MKVTLRKREVFEAETALKILSELDMDQKLAYAVAKNIRIIGNEAQDIRTAVTMNKEKNQAANLFQEKRQIVLQDASMTADKRFELIKGFEEQFVDARNALDDHKRATELTLAETVELELWEIDIELLPATMPGNALGPMVECIVDKKEAKAE